ncbi:hypothetical protein BaRGS_00020485, partial [Batillaria attramentaria]
LVCWHPLTSSPSTRDHSKVCHCSLVAPGSHQHQQLTKRKGTQNGGRAPSVTCANLSTIKTLRPRRSYGPLLLA